MERVEHKVGEIFEYNNVKLQVSKNEDEFTCRDCYFIHKGIECDKQVCLRNERHDRQSVIFKSIH